MRRVVRFALAVVAVLCLGSDLSAACGGRGKRVIRHVERERVLFPRVRGVFGFVAAPAASSCAPAPMLIPLPMPAVPKK